MKNTNRADNELLNIFLYEIDKIKGNLNWEKEEIISLFNKMIPEFLHEEKNRYLDQRM